MLVPCVGLSRGCATSTCPANTCTVPLCTMSETLRDSQQLVRSSSSICAEWKMWVCVRCEVCDLWCVDWVCYVIYLHLCIYAFISSHTHTHTHTHTTSHTPHHTHPIQNTSGFLFDLVSGIVFELSQVTASKLTADVFTSSNVSNKLSRDYFLFLGTISFHKSSLLRQCKAYGAWVDIQLYTFS